jgi:hypothetical protein
MGNQSAECGKWEILTGPQLMCEPVAIGISAIAETGAPRSSARRTNSSPVVSGTSVICVCLMLSKGTDEKLKSVTSSAEEFVEK